MAGKITYRCFERPINDSHANSVLKNIFDNNKTMGGPICLHNSVELHYARIQ